MVQVSALAMSFAPSVVAFQKSDRTVEDGGKNDRSARRALPTSFVTTKGRPSDQSATRTLPAEIPLVTMRKLLDPPSKLVTPCRIGCDGSYTVPSVAWMPDCNCPLRGIAAYPPVSQRPCNCADE